MVLTSTTESRLRIIPTKTVNIALVKDLGKDRATCLIRVCQENVMTKEDFCVAAEFIVYLMTEQYKRLHLKATTG